MRIRELAMCASMLVALAIAATGCSDSSPSPSASAQKAHAPGPKPDDSEVRVATAETPIPPLADSPPQPASTDDRAQSNPAAQLEDGGQEPAKLPVAKATPSLDELSEAELTMPRVSLTQAHVQACRVHVGDQFPDLELVDLAGQKQSLTKLLGPKLTVVVFWNGKKSAARQQLADLDPEIASRFLAQGLAVVSVNTGDDPQLASELAKQASAAFPVLSDRDAAALEQVAPGKIPSTYLLDATGKTLWFDIEYSRTTRRELVQAIRYTLARQ
jgi:peroxiredoxin